MGVFRILVKGLFALSMLAAGFVILCVSLCLRTVRVMDQQQLLFIVKKWYQFLLFLLDIKVHIQFEQPNLHKSKGLVVVANHISWLDIVVLGSVIPTHFLSKAEVRKWPVIGWMAHQVGTLFIQRGVGDADIIKNQMLDYVNDGKNILFFPEGTTGKGHELLVFRPRLFATAIDAKADILPISIKYGQQQGFHPVVPFVNGQAMLENVLQVMAHGHVDVYLKFAAPISSKNTTRDALANASQKQIGEMLNLAKPQIKQRFQRTSESVVH